MPCLSTVPRLNVRNAFASGVTNIIPYFQNNMQNAAVEPAILAECTALKKH